MVKQLLVLILMVQVVVGPVSLRALAQSQPASPPEMSAEMAEELGNALAANLKALVEAPGTGCWDNNGNFREECLSKEDRAFYQALKEMGDAAEKEAQARDASQPPVGSPRISTPDGCEVSSSIALPMPIATVTEPQASATGAAPSLVQSVEAIADKAACEEHDATVKKESCGEVIWEEMTSGVLGLGKDLLAWTGITEKDDKTGTGCLSKIASHLFDSVTGLFQLGWSAAKAAGSWVADKAAGFWDWVTGAEDKASDNAAMLSTMTQEEAKHAEKDPKEASKNIGSRAIEFLKDFAKQWMVEATCTEWESIDLSDGTKERVCKNPPCALDNMSCRETLNFVCSMGGEVLGMALGGFVGKSAKSGLTFAKGLFRKADGALKDLVIPGSGLIKGSGKALLKTLRPALKVAEGSLWSLSHFSSLVGLSIRFSGKTIKVLAATPLKMVMWIDGKVWSLPSKSATFLFRLPYRAAKAVWGELPGTSAVNDLVGKAARKISAVGSMLAGEEAEASLRVIEKYGAKGQTTGAKFRAARVAAYREAYAESKAYKQVYEAAKNATLANPAKKELLAAEKAARETYERSVRIRKSVGSRLKTGEHPFLNKAERDALPPANLNKESWLNVQKEATSYAPDPSALGETRDQRKYQDDNAKKVEANVRTEVARLMSQGASKVEIEQKLKGLAHPNKDAKPSEIKAFQKYFSQDARAIHSAGLKPDQVQRAIDDVFVAKELKLKPDMPYDDWKVIPEIKEELRSARAGLDAAKDGEKQAKQIEFKKKLEEVLMKLYSYEYTKEQVQALLKSDYLTSEIKKDGNWIAGLSEADVSKSVDMKFDEYAKDKAKHPHPLTEKQKEERIKEEKRVINRKNHEIQENWLKKIREGKADPKVPPKYLEIPKEH